MADPFIAEIRLVASMFAPKGWALCNGHLLPIAQNTALFSLLGTTYGGDGKSNFAIPDLQGRAPMHHGTGQGLTPRHLGESNGAAAVTLTADHLPAHSHVFNRPGIGAAAATNHPAAALAAITNEPCYSNTGTRANMGASALSASGGSQPHNNMQPYLTLTFIIALQGIFPPRW